MFDTIDKLNGLVAQWTRARGFGPRCRGFESLLARPFVIQWYGEFLKFTVVLDDFA
jgi:hypothetical protein